MAAGYLEPDYKRERYEESGPGLVVMTVWKYLIGWRLLRHKSSPMSDCNVSVEISNWMALAVA
jgi:hypothetical protein